MNLTNEQILDNVANNGEFAINFIIDNNPNAVAENLTSYGVELPNNPSNETIRNVLDELMITAPESDIQDILNVPYINEPLDPNNYTGGLQAQLECPNPPCPREAIILTLAIISAVATVGVAVAGVVRSKKEKETAEIYAEQQAQLLAEQQRLEAENKILGINKSTFYVIVGLLALVMVIVVISNKK